MKKNFPKKLFLIVLIFLFPLPARAQVRWDAGALGAFEQRFVGSTVAEGGALTVEGHVALFPLLRLGGWATGEVSQRLDDSPVRGIFGGGLQIKITSPWPRGVWRAWLATGFGYDGLVSDAGGGGFFEVPVILGASYRFRRPWVFLMELAARPSFGFWGSYYAPGATDAIALALSFGVGISE